jgi:hypothetical protein
MIQFLTDDAEIITQFGDSINLVIGNCKVMIMHNDSGFTVDYYKDDEDEPFKEDQIWFDELKK